MEVDVDLSLTRGMDSAGDLGRLDSQTYTWHGFGGRTTTRLLAITRCITFWREVLIPSISNQLQHQHPTPTYRQCRRDDGEGSGGVSDSAVAIGVTIISILFVLGNSRLLHAIDLTSSAFGVIEESCCPLLIASLR